MVSPAAGRRGDPAVTVGRARRSRRNGDGTGRLFRWTNSRPAATNTRAVAGCWRPAQAAQGTPHDPPRHGLELPRADAPGRTRAIGWDELHAGQDERRRSLVSAAALL